jgi:hypothetical protein
MSNASSFISPSRLKREATNIESALEAEKEAESSAFIRELTVWICRLIAFYHSSHRTGAGSSTDLESDANSQNNQEPGCCVLCFLPGLEEMEKTMAEFDTAFAQAQAQAQAQIGSSRSNNPNTNTSTGTLSVDERSYIDLFLLHSLMDNQM